MKASIVVVTIAALAAGADAQPHRRGRAAVAVVIDRSGSMQGAKVEHAKTAAIAAVAALRRDDEIAIVAFDSQATVIAPRQKASNRRRIAREVAKLEPGGGTQVLAGLAAARDQLRDTRARRKHVIVVSDGASPYDGVHELVDEMRAEGITVSAIGLSGADRNLLSLIADGGDGRLYMIGDITTLPKIVGKEVGEAAR